MSIETIRNFSIIAHIDHGKSTLADRILEKTGLINKHSRVKHNDQILDDMDLERERGITIKSHPIRLNYTKDGTIYQLNMIDTPGHVDFTYEVSRSLAACEGALLLVDATQGVQAQTLINTRLALEQNINIIPIINKIDLPSANIATCREQIKNMLSKNSEILEISAKKGYGITEVIDNIITKIVHPNKNYDNGSCALIFDSVYDSYKGVIAYVKIKSGTFKKGDKIRLFNSKLESEIKDLGYFEFGIKSLNELSEGSVGYIISNIKNPNDIKIGDTITRVENLCSKPIPGFKPIKPLVFSGIYPINNSEYNKLKLSLERLQLNDSALTYKTESSLVLGSGFRCGFLGLLHMEIIRERLNREYNIDILSTYPNVMYKIYDKNNKVSFVENPSKIPIISEIKKIEEPTIKANLTIPNICINSIMNLIIEKRGEYKKTETLENDYVLIEAILPMNEILINFYDKFKSLTKGYGIMNYEIYQYIESDLVKLNIIVNNKIIDAFSMIVHRSMAEYKGRKIIKKLRDSIPRQLFSIPVQAAVGNKIIAREDVRQLKKNVLSKCYGGDITRKRKLLEKQQKGKKRMKQFGSVNISQDVFINFLKSD